MNKFVKKLKKKLTKREGPEIKSLTEEQAKNIENKFNPKPDREYVVTDQCFWEQNPPENYNVLDPKRTPHSITLVDRENGSIVMLESGSIIKVVKQYKHQP